MSVVETRSIFSKPCINGKCYQEKIHQKYAHEQKKKVKLQFFLMVYILRRHAVAAFKFSCSNKMYGIHSVWKRQPTSQLNRKKLTCYEVKTNITLNKSEEKIRTGRWNIPIIMSLSGKSDGARHSVLLLFIHVQGARSEWPFYTQCFGLAIYWIRTFYGNVISTCVSYWIELDWMCVASFTASIKSESQSLAINICFRSN